MTVSKHKKKLYKKLTDKEIERLKKDIVAGGFPSDLAEKYGIGIASVYNWKNRLKEEGHTLKEIPKGAKPHDSEPVQDHIGAYKDSTKGIHLNINGVQVNIDPNVKSVKIHADGNIDIKF